MKISEEWDTVPTDKKVSMAASMETPATDRICFKFQTNECLRPKCPFIHRIMNEKEKENKIPITPLGLKEINNLDSLSEEDTEGSESASPVFDPTDRKSTRLNSSHRR